MTHSHVVKVRSEQGVHYFPCQSADEAWQTGEHLFSNGAQAFTIMPVRDMDAPDSLPNMQTFGRVRRKV